MNTTENQTPQINFSDRHIGPREKDIVAMLKTLNLKTLDDLIKQSAPSEILNCKKLNLPKPLSETECLKELRTRASQNKIFKNYIGMGYYETKLPTVIQRNILENPVWLTSYTPYQSEISQGRLQALLNFQTLITELTEMDTANSSLLDEGTAGAEAISIAVNNRQTEIAKNIFVDENIFPQTKAVIKTRAHSMGLNIITGNTHHINFSQQKFICVVIQYPDSTGAVHDWEVFCKKANQEKVITLFLADPLSLCLLKTPGAMGADIVAGSCQRMGVPLFFGGPHAGYIAVKEKYTRSLPGRIVGVSKDRHGKRALRLTLQTREQHIRRERATSNICTAQALLAVLSGMYALYHGPTGLRKMAKRVHLLALSLSESLKKMNFKLKNEKRNIFDTVQIELPKNTAQFIYEKFIQNKINIAKIPVPNTSPSSASDTNTNTLNKNTSKVSAVNINNKNSLSEIKVNQEKWKNNNHTILSFSINETTTTDDIKEILQLIKTSLEEENTKNHQPNKNKSIHKSKNEGLREKAFLAENTKPIHKSKSPYQNLFKKISHSPLPKELIRKTACLKHPVFQTYHSETQMLRYIHQLQEGDLSLTHSMIPLGSCTMKLNGTTELLPVSWPEFSEIHPFAPSSQTTGYIQIIKELEQYLCEITNFSAVSFQPNAGSQGEYTGLLMVRRYHQQKKDKKRTICLIPSSAHGTNPASAVMAGLKPVTVQCDKEGNISREDLKNKITQHKNELACIMLTFPSTFGVFEEQIQKICEDVHSAGGLVYLDGANMNALIGISQPAKWGADVCHLNLHKTFCIPHGGGGPGVGPVAVTTALKKFLPCHPVVPECGPTEGLSAVSSAPYGSAGILMIPWTYIRLMGAEKLKKATQVAVLNANYIAKKLSGHYKILYTGKNNKVAHECILDFRKFKNTAEITVDDVAKRLTDYSFHAPTMNWPVPGTLMVEPTESENKQELDRFCSALVQIRKEIQEIEERKVSLTNNVLKNAPHTLEDVLEKEWRFPYSKEKAFYPLPWVKERKFWPKVSRVENAYGDINLFCSCPPPS